MMILWKERLAFLAVPKTGTHAIEEVLAPRASIRFDGPPNVRHVNARSFHRFLRPYLDFAGGAEIETFAVIREPVEWLGSWYRYRRRPALDGHPNSTARIGFAAFVEEYLAPEPRPFARVGGQARFLTLADGTLGVDHLFRHDRPQDLVRFLSARLGQTVILPTRNVSPRGDDDLRLPETLLDRLRAHFATDYALFDLAASQAPARGA